MTYTGLSVTGFIILIFFVSFSFSPHPPPWQWPHSWPSEHYNVVVKVKVKVKLYLHIINNHAKKTYQGVEVQVNTFLILETGGSECSGSCPGYLVSIRQKAERAPKPVWMLWRWEESLPMPEIEPWVPYHPACSLAAILAEISQLHDNNVTRVSTSKHSLSYLIPPLVLEFMKVQHFQQKSQSLDWVCYVQSILPNFLELEVSEKSTHNESQGKKETTEAV
jgi:hypothetical protein